MRRSVAHLFCGAILASAASAQQIAALPDNPLTHGGLASDSAITNRKNARTITLSIPAPRGAILDRNGSVIASNRIAWQLGLQFEQFEKADRPFVIDWARQRLAKAKLLVKDIKEPTDDELWNHYNDRRWLPLLISTHLHEAEKKKIEPGLPKGLILHPVYQRYYPGGDSAAHIIGYAGSMGKLPTGPINFEEPMWEETEGRGGLEELYNKNLTGQPGIKKLLYDEFGRKFPEEQPRRPRPGGTVVSTLNMAWQKHAEQVLKEKSKRGAFVLIDVNTGEVLVMASRPSFDLNQFIPSISDKELKALDEDPSAPRFGRAFQSKYPPGSCFKPMVALTALNSGKIDEDTTIDCPAAITLGNHTFHNHNKRAAGSINVIQALASSNNIWFGKVGMNLGANAFLGTARRFGFGTKTGLDLIGETEGTVPTNEWMMKVHKRPFKDGDDFNLSIGQGSLEVSPLQVAQAMAGIANGGVLPKLHLVMQVQDPYGRVINQAVPDKRNWLGIKLEDILVVRKGMRAVVDGGTGKAAELSFAELCGKTGTAQWNNDRNLAWFAGFLPYDEPRFAFAAVYEGSKGEKPSGGKNAAPIVKSFFEPLKDEFKDILAPAPKAVEVVEEDGAPAEGEGKALEVNEDGVLKAQEVKPLHSDEKSEGTQKADKKEEKKPKKVEPVDEGEGKVAPKALPVDEEEMEDSTESVPVDD
ncbi:penicillin-binding transpeptidase domain-containing protein [Haloferula sp. BvORR071]|uniref:peptidoglycan D,D-transpeptidase FtsI family protein n=1 Tax=Haloferula sp. BvORR071 TaxID=1396141 RepID=UPI002240F59C|nr:penicillin-binding transpeptidase domain-containing protein [Haloferula sp. BvORR071]